MRRRKGFTLIELMIVMVIIAILLSLLLPGVFQGQNKAVKIKCQNNLRQCGIALYAYAGDHDGTIPNAWTDLTNNDYLDTDEVTKCPKDGTAYTLINTTSSLYSLDTSISLAGCSTHHIAVYADGHVE